jgi:hypothetical protein
MLVMSFALLGDIFDVSLEDDFTNYDQQKVYYFDFFKDYFLYLRFQSWL